MNKVSITFYRNRGNEEVKTVYDIIPNSISFRCRKNGEQYVAYDIEDGGYKFYSWTDLTEGMTFSIFSNKK